MILSGRDIELYMSVGKLTITNYNPVNLQQNGIDLVLDTVDGRPHTFMRGHFYLGATKEVLELPDDLMAFVGLRSTWARRGLLLPPTVVDAGFHGNLTLEIASFTNIAVPYGERFAHLIFAKMSGPGVPYSGKYQHQGGITPAISD